MIIIPFSSIIRSRNEVIMEEKDKLELVTIKSVIINIVYQQEGETEW